MLLGALRIKHQANLNDSVVIAAIHENFYMLFLLDWKNFQQSRFLIPHCLCFDSLKELEQADLMRSIEKLIQSISKEENKKQDRKRKKVIISK